MNTTATQTVTLYGITVPGWGHKDYEATTERAARVMAFEDTGVPFGLITVHSMRQVRIDSLLG